MNLVPYLKDYKSKKEIEKDFNNDRDFLINDFFNPYDGKPINKSQIVEEGIREVSVRYNNLRKKAIIVVK